MIKIKRTKKLIEASRILAGEMFCDTDDEKVYQVALAGLITVKQIYQALHHFGYRYQNGLWALVYPNWILKFYKTERLVEDGEQ